MAKFRMEIEGAERVAELMDKVSQKAYELQELAEQLGAAALSLRLSGTLDPSDGVVKATQEDMDRF